MGEMEGENVLGRMKSKQQRRNKVYNNNNNNIPKPGKERKNTKLKWSVSSIKYQSIRQNKSKVV